MFTTFFKKNHDNSDVFKKLIHRLSDMSVQDLEKIDRLIDIIFTPNQETEQLKTEETYSGFLELGPNSKPVPITNVLTYERLLPCGKNIVIGPRLSAALFVDNIDYLDRLQKSKIDISILDTYLREINKNKPKDFYYYL